MDAGLREAAGITEQEISYNSELIKEGSSHFLLFSFFVCAENLKIMKDTDLWPPWDKYNQEEHVSKNDTK